jgi:hypothetical protein
MSSETLDFVESRQYTRRESAKRCLVVLSFLGSGAAWWWHKNGEVNSWEALKGLDS